MAQRFNVRAFRDSHGLSAQRVADSLGVALRTVQRWDNGEADPSPMALKALRDLKNKHEPPRDTTASSDPAPASDKPRRPALLPSIE